MHELRVLDLGPNKIDLLNFDLFFEGNKIEEFYISFNQIHTIESDFFKEAKRLKILNISYNKLIDLSQICFPCMLDLTKINFGYNNIFKIPNLDKNTNLEYIGLFNNNISTIQSNAFNNLLGLDRIILQDNPIEFIEPNAFLNCQKLDKIWLPINNLENECIFNFLNTLNNFAAEKMNDVQYFKSSYVISTDQKDQRLCFLIIYFLRYRIFLIQQDLFNYLYNIVNIYDNNLKYYSDASMEHFLENCLDFDISELDQFEMLVAPKNQKVLIRSYLTKEKLKLLNQYYSPETNLWKKYFECFILFILFTFLIICAIFLIRIIAHIMRN